MMERFRTWHEILMERLSDPEDVIGYLEVSLEEYLEDGDKAFFLIRLSYRCITRNVLTS